MLYGFIYKHGPSTSWHAYSKLWDDPEKREPIMKTYNHHIAFSIPSETYGYYYFDPEPIPLDTIP